MINIFPLTCRLRWNTLNVARSVICQRHYALIPGTEIFDRKSKRQQRDRAALKSDSRQSDYLKDAVAENLADRLLDTTREYTRVLDLGSGAGHFVKYLPEDRVEAVTQLDSSSPMLFRDKGNAEIEATYKINPEYVLADEEWLPFAPKTFDAVVSNLSMHWINDLPSLFKQVRQVLKDDGLFLGAMFGEETLYELRSALQLASLEREGGFAPRTSPMTFSSDVGSLLQGAGFKLLTVDVDPITVRYPSLYELLGDIKLMGEGNATLKRQNYLRRDVLTAAAAIYREIYGEPDGTIPATFDIIYFIGWTPDPSQAPAAERGSATFSLKDLDKL